MNTRRNPAYASTYLAADAALACDNFLRTIVDGVKGVFAEVDSMPRTGGFQSWIDATKEAPEERFMRAERERPLFNSDASRLDYLRDVVSRFERGERVDFAYALSITDRSPHEDNDD